MLILLNKSTIHLFQGNTLELCGIICILSIIFSVSQLEIVDNSLGNYTYKKALYLSLALSHEREAYTDKRGLHSSLSASTALPIES